MKRKDFDLLETEIGAGPILIEASAGTGKTYTIAGLVLRLLLERSELTIDRILVTTFTELATAELRGRIRDLLHRALDAFQTGESDDDLIAAMLRKHPDHRAAATRLNDALVDFDEAPIYTIHGFCQRVLAERAFETGTLFDAELVTDERELLHEIASDFWRRRFHIGDSLGTLLALHGKITPKRLFNDLEELVENPTLTILPEDLRDPNEAAESAREALDELRAIWPVEAESIRSLFANPSWGKGAYKDAAVLGSLLDDLERCLFRRWGHGYASSLVSRRWRRVRFHKGVRAKHSLPQKRTFDACEKFSDRAAESASHFAQNSMPGRPRNCAGANRNATSSRLKICSRAWTTRFGAKEARSWRSRSATNTARRSWMNSRTPIRCSIPFSNASTAGATRPSR